MIICANCGHTNEDGADFCANPDCKAYLQWEEPATREEPTPSDESAAGNGSAPGDERISEDERALAMRTPVSLAPPQAPPEEKRQGVLVTLAREPVVVEAGEEVTLGVRVRNTGTIVEEFVLEVTGAPAAWTTIEPASLSLFPGADQSAVITFQPPRAPDTPAGALPFRVKATSKVDPSVSGSDSGVVTVKGFRLLSVELAPQVASGRWMTTHRLSVTNQGNLPLSATIRGKDPTEDLRFKVTPEELELGANSQGSVKVRALSRRWLWTSRRGSVQHPFQVVTRPEDSPAVTTDGTMTQLPLLPGWILRAVAAVCAIALAFGGVALVRSLTRKPEVVLQTPAVTESPSAPAPPPPVAAPPAAPAPAPAPAPGAGAGAEKPAGAGAGKEPEKPAEESPAAPAKVKVPGVAGQSGPTAIQALQAAGLKPELQQPEVNNAVAKDSVIRSEPAADTEVEKDSAVKLFVSSGPTPPFDLLNVAKDAVWSTGAGTLAFGSTGSNGSVTLRQNVPLEDQNTARQALETNPQPISDGFIQGEFKLPAPIIAGDRFTSRVGFLAGGAEATETPTPSPSPPPSPTPSESGAGEVDFLVMVVDAQGTPRVAGSVHDKSDDARLQQLDVDLSDFAGAQTIRLRVNAGSSAESDAGVVWVDPTIAGKAGG